MYVIYYFLRHLLKVELNANSHQEEYQIKEN